MTETKTPTKPDIVELAKKKRYLHLLEKVQTGKALSSVELRELSKYESPLGPGELETKEQVAAAFGVAIRTIHYWIRQGMPVSPNGRFDIGKIQEWRLSTGQKKNTEVILNREALDTRLKEIRIKREEAKLKKELGELITKYDVEKVMNQLITVFKRSFLSLPRSLAPQLVGLEPREIEAIISARIKEIIISFSQGKKLFK
ncbi:MAG: hypothetical protein PHO42_03545 [Candidatus Omnitrophica bacterium]|nr:hypothetical protein [Candidatus Omnitrophota bacterium]